MTYVFFDASDKTLFIRNDAEKAQHNHQEMSFYALFPCDEDKAIREGMRVGYTDSTGAFIAFEITKVKTYEPDHYQEVTTENIAVSELSDEIYTGGDIMDASAQTAFEALLSGTSWRVGECTSEAVSSVKLTFGEVWGHIRSAERNFNMYISPRITVGRRGITGRYIDIAPAAPVWRGLRFSLEKNLDDASVIWDESGVKTALYGFGRSETKDGEKSALTFADVVWEKTAEHPAKPKGQKYIEDAEATAASGRNGRARFGYYQNGDVSDPQKLLELTWEALKAARTPEVTIEGYVRDISKFGKVDVPIRLHDSAVIEITPTGELLNREVTQYTEDLEEPENSRVTIGKYIPNIVYIARETASGRGGGGGSGGDTDEEYKLKEYETAILWNDYQLSLKAWQRDLDKTDENLLLAYAAIGISANQIDSIVTGSGVTLDEDGNIVADSSGYPVFKDGSTQIWTRTIQNADAITAEVIRATGAEGTLSSRITQTADAITAEVTRATEAEGNLSSRITANATAITSKVSAGDIASTINQTAQSVLIQASKIDLEVYVTVSDLSATNAQITNLTSGRPSLPLYYTNSVGKW